MNDHLPKQDRPEAKRALPGEGEAPVTPPSPSSRDMLERAIYKWGVTVLRAICRSEIISGLRAIDWLGAAVLKATLRVIPVLV